MNIFANDVAFSMVDDSFLYASRDQPNPLVLPAYVAVEAGTNRILACGQEALAMLGREPRNILVLPVLSEGLVANLDAAIALFRFGLRTFTPRFHLVRPRIVVALRSCEIGKLPAKQMAMAGGAREVYLLEMGMATAIGWPLDVQKPEIRAVLSISNDWFEFAVVSLAGVLAAAGGAIGSRSFAEDARNHLSVSGQFRPELATVESTLLSTGLDLGAAADLPGWESWAGKTETGRHVSQPVSGAQLALGAMPSLVRLTERIKDAILGLPPEKRSRLNQTTLHAAGSALRIPGLARAISLQTGLAVETHSAETHPSIEGATTVLGELNHLRKIPSPRS